MELIASIGTFFSQVEDFFSPYAATITVAGTVFTIISAVVAFFHARSAINARDEVRDAIARVTLAVVSERLRLAQEHIRNIAPGKSSARGFNPHSALGEIRKEFDTALGELPIDGIANEARQKLRNAQTKLNEYEASMRTQPDSEKWAELQNLVQDAVSILKKTAISDGVS